MTKKIMSIFLAIIMVMPVVFPVFALSKEDILARLDELSVDIKDMKEKYEEILETYPDVIDSLSTANKDAIENLAENMTDDNIKETINSIKEELANSTVENADKVLEGIEALEDDAKALIDENKDLIEDVKSGYKDLSAKELEEVLDKVKDVVGDLGYNTDTTATFNSLKNILDDAHDIALEVNDMVEDMLKKHHDVFIEGLEKTSVKEVAEAVKTKDINEVIAVIEKTLNKLSGAEAEAAKADVKAAKNKAVELKNVIKKVKNLDKLEILMFTDVQIETISDKVKDVEKDYIAFVKLIINNYLQQYVGSIMEVSYGKSIDTAIDYANDVLDYVEEFKSTKDITTEDLIDRLPKGVVENAGLLVAMGFVDVERYNKQFILDNFDPEINKTIDFLAEEVIDYLSNLETTLEKEIKAELDKNLDASTTQTNVKGLTSKRFTTVTKLKALKKRADDIALNKVQSVKEKVELVEPLAYDIFYSNILMSIEKTMGLEKEKSNKEYEFNETRGYIITDSFMKTANIYSKLGIPSANKSVLTFEKVASSKIRTGSTMLITLGENIEETYTYAVLGDVYADGIVDARDYMMIKNYIMEKETLDAIKLLAADPYRDSTIDARDYMMIKNQIMEKDEISL
ncbi:MAG: hypothetical protein IKL68_05410 [Clostridia bacterium]|nr:hypothetical protein [Clostridia bacterium]